MNLSVSSLFSGIIFGAIGFSAFIYGKKEGEWKPMVIGAVLMIFPYFVADTVTQYILGAILTAALFMFR